MEPQKRGRPKGSKNKPKEERAAGVDPNSKGIKKAPKKDQKQQTRIY